VPVPLSPFEYGRAGPPERPGGQARADAPPGAVLVLLWLLGAGSFMVNDKHKAQGRSGADRGPAVHPGSRSPRSLLIFGLGVLLGAGGLLLASRLRDGAASPQPPLSAGDSLNRLLGMTREELGGLDIARMNLACAEGLPGAEGLDVAQCLSRLDDWAQRVRCETQRHLYRVTDPRYADQYRKSESYFRASMMLQVLQEDCGVHYNKQRVRDVDFKNSRDLFLHGLVGGASGGTCVSMPVLYVAVGRRLGYPMRLVLAKAHVFARWDDAADLCDTAHPRPPLRLDGLWQTHPTPWRPSLSSPCATTPYGLS